MAKDGKFSCSIKSRHIRIKLLWVDNRVKQWKTSAKHCPTEKMLAYFFTKPLQDSKFKLFRRVIMGWYGVLTVWDDSDDKDNLSKNNVDMDDGHIDGNSCHVYCGHTYSNKDAHTWSEVVRTGTIVGRNVYICIA